MASPMRERIEAANAQAVGRITSADPVLIDIAPAGEVIPGLVGRMILHSGPPVGWSRMCGAQRGACIGMVLFEGWAKNPAEAEQLLASGAITLEPNHHHQAVGPMAGTITRSLPVFVVKDTASGSRACCRQVEGRQQFGDYSDEALDGLRRWRDIWAPSLRQGIQQKGGVTLRPIIAKALQMGDELHNRPVAATTLFADVMALAMVEAGVSKNNLLATLAHLTYNEFFFLGLSMASAKAFCDAAAGIAYSTVVTAMARNGTEFGIRVSGLGDEWYTAPAPRIDGLYLTGYSADDAGLDMGDSAITETVGWGGFVLGGAPGILSLIGGTSEQAMQISRDMGEITVATHPTYRIPALGFVGAPVGIDIVKVMRSGIVPVIDTAIAHKDPGYPKIGAGMVRAPSECFEKALQAYARRYGLS